MLQRLIDPKLCVTCFGCHEACPKGAIVIERRRVAIDPMRCAQCADCAAECMSEAIDVLRPVPASGPWSVAEQLSWDELPPPGLD